MKTIEEKAQAYDEALERAKKVHKYSSDIAEIKRMEHIFPELRESEDEKTRKEIVGYLKKNLRLEWATWLEKQGEKKCIDDLTQQEAMDIAVAKCFEQGEQKPAEWSEEDESMYTRTLGILGKCYMGQLPTKVEEELNWLKYRLKYLISQNQWKPSDEQIRTLEYYMHALIATEHKEVLFGLYEQLKKLTE